MGCQKHFAKLQKMKNTKSKIKPIKIGEQPEFLARKSENNKVLREKSRCVICRSNKSGVLKQKIN